ncbi:MAG: hypothetical protein HQ565_00230 [Bacteroidetes bacterium]|nr:hypothetical protein [Bacteroidota bacterium]
MTFVKYKRTYTYFILDVWWFAISVIFLILPALQNGYPLLHPDSGTYIYFGFLDMIPVSRPISYCWLVRHISMSYSLWLVVIFQGILLTAFLNMLIHKLIGSKKSVFLTFILISILSVFTALPVYVSHIMPDMYFSIAFIGIFLILTANKIRWAWIIPLSFIVIYSIIVHLSNLPIITAVTIAAVVLFYFFKRFAFIRIYPKRLFIVAIILLLSWLSIPSINASFGAGFGFSRVSNIVFTARLIPSGIFSDYVTEKCETDTSFFLCEFKNVIPKYTRYDYFLWKDSSFLYQQDCEDTKGFAECWIKRDSLFGVLVSDIMSIPKYRTRYLQDAVQQFGNQLVTFQLGSNPPFGETSHINYPIKTYFEDDYRQYLEARQQNYRIMHVTRNAFQRVLIVISLLVILLFFSLKGLRKYISIDFLTFFSFYVLLILANAGLIAFVSVVVGRFEGRLIWFIPVMAFILLARYILMNDKKVKL